MKVTIEITCDNAAFQPDAGAEVARILRSLAQWIASGRSPFATPFAIMEQPATLFDINGNKVGSLTVEGGAE